MFGSHKVQDFIMGAFVGSAMGALATLLFTTQKGKQIRQTIADKYHELEEGLKSTAENVEEAAESTVKKAASKVKKDDSKD
ncbi:MAG: YtxH domain-containing protein [Rhabdochlamydiaceae bacterium]